MRFVLNFVFMLTLSLLSDTLLAQDFTAYESKGLRDGDGGAKKTVEGVDFWSEGSPPFKFKIIGVITDRRHKTGLIGKMRMASLETDVAQIAKENGGDGVILAASEAEAVGALGMAQGNSFGNGSVAGFGASVGVQKQNTKYFVVKYYKDEPKPAAEVKPAAVNASEGSTTAPAATGAKTQQPAAAQQ